MELRNLLVQANSYNNFPSDEKIDFGETILVHNLTIRFLVKMLAKSVVKRRRILLRICLPYGIMVKHPDW